MRTILTRIQTDHLLAAIYISIAWYNLFVLHISTKRIELLTLSVVPIVNGKNEFLVAFVGAYVWIFTFLP